MPFAANPGQAVLPANGGVLVAGGSIPSQEAVIDVCEPNAGGVDGHVHPGDPGGRLIRWSLTAGRPPPL